MRDSLKVMGDQKQNTGSKKTQKGIWLYSLPISSTLNWN